MPCYICSSSKHVDAHHIDCCGGELSPETVPLCRRCHRTYHDLGIEWFDDEFLDKAIEIKNRQREIQRASRHGAMWHTGSLSPLKREDVRRSSYFNEKHGTKPSRGRKVVAISNNAGQQYRRVIPSRDKSKCPGCGAHGYQQLPWQPPDGLDPLIIMVACSKCDGTSYIAPRLKVKSRR